MSGAIGGGEWAGRRGRRGARGRKGQLALCLHAVPGWGAGRCPEGPRQADCQLRACDTGKRRGAGLQRIRALLTWPPAHASRPQLASSVRAGAHPLGLRGGDGGAEGAGSRSGARGWFGSGGRGPRRRRHKYYRSLANPELCCLAVNIPRSVCLSPLVPHPPSPATR